MQVKNDFLIIGFSADFDIETICDSGKVIQSAAHYRLKLKHSEIGYEMDFPCSKEILEKYMHATKISIEFIIAD